MKFEAPKEVYFGKEYEYDLVGSIEVDASGYLAELERLQKLAKERGFKPRQKNSLPFKEALELTKKFQPQDPTHPRKEFARDFRLALAEKFGLETPQELDRLKIFTCIDGPLDAHGIDFFVSFAASQGKKENIITFDITKNPKKDLPARADFLVAGDIPDRSDHDFDEKKYLKVIDNYADRVFAFWQEKTKEGKHARFNQAA